MATRNKEELLGVMLENVGIIGISEKICGLCLLSVRLYVDGKISTEEKAKIALYIAKNRPRNSSPYSWEEYQSAPRRDWLVGRILIEKENNR